MGLRVQSNLPSELEDLVKHTIDSCFDVHVELGPGWLEGVYLRAVCLELNARFRMRPKSSFPSSIEDRLDLFIDQQLVLELKAVEQIHSIHIAQMSYLRASQSRVGLLINFNVPVFKQGVRRVVL
jgi:GxxExxY protein